jgi:hypothetical protein
MLWNQAGVRHIHAQERMHALPRLLHCNKASPKRTQLVKRISQEPSNNSSGKGRHSTPPLFDLLLSKAATRVRPEAATALMPQLHTSWQASYTMVACRPSVSTKDV